jgi:hypothetical protein
LPSNVLQAKDLEQLGEDVLERYMPRMLQQHQRLLGGGRAFSHLGLNSFRSATHVDMNDMRGTVTVMFVFSPDTSIECYVLLPQIRAAVLVRSGDCLIFSARNVVHANSALMVNGVAANGLSPRKERELWEKSRISATLFCKPDGPGNGRAGKGPLMVNWPSDEDEDGIFI